MSFLRLILRSRVSLDHHQKYLTTRYQHYVLIILLINTIKYSFNQLFKNYKATLNDTEGVDTKQHEKLAVLVVSCIAYITLPDGATEGTCVPASPAHPSTRAHNHRLHLRI
jgi:hypothetical protein